MCRVDSGPESSSVDVGNESCGKADESQPIMQPCDNDTKFALEKISILLILKKQKCNKTCISNTDDCGIVLLPNVNLLECFC